MVDTSLIWTSRTWPPTGNPPPVLTVPPEQPDWSSEAADARGTAIPRKGFLAALVDAPLGVSTTALQSAIEQAWHAISEGQMTSELTEIVSMLMRHAQDACRAQGGSASLAALVVVVRGEDMAWSSSGDCRLFFCRAGGSFEDFTRNSASPQGHSRLNSGDLLILGNAELARRTTITGQAGDIENITEDNADGWLESLQQQADDGATISFCMIGVRALLPATIATAAGVASAATPVMVTAPAREVVEAGVSPTQSAELRQGTATIYPAASAPAGGIPGLPRRRIIVTALLVALLGLGGIYFWLRGAASTTPAAGTSTTEPARAGLPTETSRTAAPTEAAVGGVATTLVPEETAVPPAPATATAAPVETPTTAAAATGPTSPTAPVATSPAVIYGAFVYPRLLDDTGYNNSVEFLTTLFGPPSAEDPAYVVYIRDYGTSNPEVRCPSGAVIWFCLGGREIPDLVPASAWVAFTGEITTASEEGFVLRSGAQTYAITEVQDLDGSLTVGNRVSIVGRVADLTWDPAAPTGARVERTGAAIPVTATFARPVSSNGRPGEWRRAMSSSSEAERPVWLYSSDRELLSELTQSPAEAAEALAQDNILIQGSLAQTAGASPRIEVRAIYSLDLIRNRYLCRYGELPDATCP